jgi:hypothetical protein
VDAFIALNFSRTAFLHPTNDVNITWETEMGRSEVLGQPKPHNKTLSQKKKLCSFSHIFNCLNAFWDFSLIQIISRSVIWSIPGGFSHLFLLLASSFIPIWPESMTYVVSIPVYLLRSVLYFVFFETGSR